MVGGGWERSKVNPITGKRVEGVLVIIKRMQKNARIEDVDDSGNLNIKLKLIEGRSLVRYREVNGIPGIYIYSC